MIYLNGVAVSFQDVKYSNCRDNTCVDKKKKWCAKKKTCDAKAKRVCKKKCGTCEGDEDNDNNDNNNDNDNKPDPFRDATLATHNKYRRMHGVEEMVWDQKVAKFSQKWCNYLRDTGSFKHSQGSGYGENLYLRTGSNSDKIDAGEGAVTGWYNEISEYEFNSPGFSFATGHFTQVVWKTSTRLGCAVSQKKESSYTKSYVCCNYSPPGNSGNYEGNVPRPL